MPKRNRELVVITDIDSKSQCLLEYEQNYYIGYIPKDLRNAINKYRDEFDIAILNGYNNKPFMNIVLLKTHECILKQQLELMD